ncbi:MAG: hypothetical protein RMK29_11760 [Myxococcales bacterium]|nr:hypothetical protein [Myxococcota bacterium]MDW8282384.1 hypothetical protein [Myxococcales bacterium]
MASRLLTLLPLGLVCCVPADDQLPASRPPLPAPPEGTVGGFGIDLPPFVLQPGEERLPCYVFPLDIQGPSRVVAAGSLTTGPGLHHGNITTRRKTGEGFRLCEPRPGDHVGFDILEGGAVLFASSTQVVGVEWQSFPAGMGFRVRDGFEIVARMHYVNATPAALTIAPRYRWYTIAEDALRQEVGPFAWSYSRFRIPPRSLHTVTAECRFDRAMYIVHALPHMHALGRRFVASFLGGPRDGRPFLDVDYGLRGESDMLLYDPAVDVTQGGAGDGVRFSCTWHNTFDKEITEGVGDNEMCILFGYAYPPQHAYSVLATDVGGCVAVLPPTPRGEMNKPGRAAAQGAGGF